MTPIDAELERFADLIRERNELEARLAAVVGRPALPGHIGEWIASRVFGIELSASAVEPEVDGHFTLGPLAGRSVNVKLYGKRENLLDLRPAGTVEFYLVLAGPRGSAASSRGTTRPLCIASAHLFETQPLLDTLTQRGVKIGVATSLRQEVWEAAEIYPSSTHRHSVTDDQRTMLRLFAPRSE